MDAFSSFVLRVFRIGMTKPFPFFGPFSVFYRITVFHVTFV